MQMLINCLLVGAGGALGSIARYLLTLVAPLPLGQDGAPGLRWIPEQATLFPFMTLFINIAGSFAIGAIMGTCVRSGALPDEAVLFLKVGVCGGFTTFSTFSLETMQLLQTGHPALAIAYAAISAIACVAAAFAGHSLGCALQLR